MERPTTHAWLFRPQHSMLASRSRIPPQLPLLWKTPRSGAVSAPRLVDLASSPLLMRDNPAPPVIVEAAALWRGPRAGVGGARTEPLTNERQPPAPVLATMDRPLADALRTPSDHQVGLEARLFAQLVN